MSSTIYGYGLPGEAPSQYNGLGGVGDGCCVGIARRRPGMFKTLPDPELGGFGDFGYTLSSQPMQIQETPRQESLRAVYTPRTQPAGGGGSVGLLAAGAVALFFLLK